MQKAITSERPGLNQRIFIIIGLGWTISIFLGILWILNIETSETHETLRNQARSYFRLIITTRLWNAGHGGVYVPVDENTQPNPYLEIPERDIVTQAGKQLTLINPAYMTRQISVIAAGQNQVQFHITSLNPLRPANAATEWEANALKQFVQADDEFQELVTDSSGYTQFQYMAPLWTEQPCLRCHAKQGYKVGDLRGGLSVFIPAQKYLQRQSGFRHMVVWIGLIVWLIGIIGVIIAYQRLYSEHTYQVGLIAELKKALSEVKTLEGLIQICASCKSIRNDGGYWEKLEHYIKDHSAAQFTHGICPDCQAKLFPKSPGLKWDKKKP